MIRKIALGLSGLVGLLLLLALVAYYFTMPEALPARSESEAWLRPGPFEVGITDLVFVDETRATSANGDAPRLANRTFPTSIWYPEGDTGQHPLVIHSHGFISQRTDLGYIAELLASHGYVVAAANFPLTSGTAVGGPNANDLVNQPADLSFLIDSVLALSGNDKPFAGEVDSSRIALMGYSLGGITTSLATYHPRLRDTRIGAAISIAGPSAGLVEKFYESSAVPFMMIAGTLDALIDFDYNAAVIPARVRNSVLIAIEGGTHLGFGSIAEPWLRLMRHPDGLGCSAVLANLDEDPNAAFIPLGDETDGIVLDPTIPRVCQNMSSEKALHPARQQMVTRIAVLAFFESEFGENRARREAASHQLNTTLEAELPEASFTSSADSARLMLQEP
ncbi:MAG: hypothetical protein WDZ52_01960 [Pseudohongiellaceae bacterium]